MTKRKPKLTSSQVVGYYGSVKFKLVRNNKTYKEYKVHNNGTELLFKRIANAIAGGSFSSINDMPSTISVYHKDGDITKDSAGNYNFGDLRCVSSPMYGTKDVVQQENSSNIEKGWNVVYSFLLPFNLLIYNQSGICDINVVVLNDSKGVPLAYLKLIDDSEESGTIQIQQSAKTNLQIEWVLTICNSI